MAVICQQVSRLRNDFFRLKPSDDGHRTGGGENLLEKMDLSNMFYDSSGSAGGGKVFRLSFDVRQFRPEEISITTHDQRLIVHAKHEGKSTQRSIFTPPSPLEQYWKQYVFRWSVRPSVCVCVFVSTISYCLAVVVLVSAAD